MALTAKQRRFVDEYLADLNATQAAIRAGYSKRTAQEQASRLLSNVMVRAAVEDAKRARSGRTGITADMVLQRYWQLATADPNELVEYRRACCRHCWGVGHAYQWTEAEFNKARREAENKDRPAPENEGGFGFEVNREPNPACPECGGEGRGRVHVHDTRKATGSARILYAGVKQGKDGLELKMHDQLAALDKVAQHVGLFRDQGAAGRAKEMHEIEAEIKRLEIEKRRSELAALQREQAHDEQDRSAAPDYKLEPDEDVPATPIL